TRCPRRSISIRISSSSLASLCTISPNPTSLSSSCFRSLVFRRLTSVRLNLSLALTLITKSVMFAFSFMAPNRMGNVEKFGGHLRGNLRQFEPAGLQVSSLAYSIDQFLWRTSLQSFELGSRQPGKDIF